MVVVGCALAGGGLPVTSVAAAGLVDGRGYELVSPVGKNGGQPTLGEGSFRASATEGALVFDSNVPANDTHGTGAIGTVTFRSDRTARSWSTRSLMPAQAENPFALFAGTGFDWFAPDLSHGLLVAGDPGLAPGAPQGVPNLYLTDRFGGLPVLLSASVNPVIRAFFGNAPSVVDASSDVTRIAFDSLQNLTADAPAQGASCLLTGDGCLSRVYEWDHGTLRLASVLPDGTPPSDAVAGPPGVRGLVNEDKALSADGSRLYFTDSSSGALYVRKNAPETVWVSQSEALVPDPSPGAATFLGASEDGTRAFFMTDEHLLDADTNGSSDLYMYSDSADPVSDSNLTLISAGNDPPATSEPVVRGVLGVSDDGQRVYFAADNQLVTGQSTAPGFKLYVWDHGTVRYITTVVDAGPGGVNWNLAAAERVSRVTAYGRYLLFTTAAPQPGGFDNAGHAELDRYDVVSGEIVCVSCGAGMGPATADASIAFAGAQATRLYPTYGLRAFSADGRRVFFSTAEALVAEDTNGKVDAYEWEDGAVHLISSGQSESDSYFVDASASGDDAYFVTRQRLVGADVDDLLDVYDARVGGGFPEPSVAHACTGETCKAAFAGPPGVEAPGTGVVAGSRRSRARAGAAVFSIAALGVRQAARWASSGHVSLRVRVPRPGRVTVHARGRLARGCVTVASASRIAGHAGAIRLGLGLSPAARARLARVGRLRVTLLVRYSQVRALKRVVVLVERASSGRSVNGSGR